MGDKDAPKKPILMPLTIVFLGVILLTILVAGTNIALKYNRSSLAMSYAINNQFYCNDSENSGKCDLTVLDDLESPIDVGVSFNYGLALYCTDLIARLALLFYKDDGLSDLVMPAGVTKYTNLYFNGSIIGYVARADTAPIIYVVFRGTVHEEEWRQDFNFNQVQMNRQESLITPSGRILECHGGFMNVFMNFEEALVEAVTTLVSTAVSPMKVVITGHSLGGSLATIASIRLSYLFDIYTYTFASPRVCNTIPQSFRFWRITNIEDFIPSIPLAVMPNLICTQKPQFYSHGGISMQFQDNRLSLTQNHLIPVYQDALRNQTLNEFIEASSRDPETTSDTVY